MAINIRMLYKLLEKERISTAKKKCIFTRKMRAISAKKNINDLAVVAIVGFKENLN